MNADINKPFAMVIEDDRETVALFRHVLEIVGYRTEVCMDGAQALERLTTTRPDIILLDLNLPGIPGRNILRFLDSVEELQHIPTVVVTGHSELAQGLETKTDLILMKPVSVEQLTSLMVRLRPASADAAIKNPQDLLTGLYSPEFFLGRLENTIDRCQQVDGSLFGILYLDILEFDQYAESLGEESVNKLLKTTGKFLRSVIRPFDMVARFDRSNFLIQIEDLPVIEILPRIARRIAANLSPQLADMMGFSPTPLIGMAHWIKDFRQPQDMLMAVDIALYFARQAPENSPVMFDPVRHGQYRHSSRYAAIRRISVDAMASNTPKQPEG
jgi:diguanylate cyclase (GGDEF)-like protein